MIAQIAMALLERHPTAEVQRLAVVAAESADEHATRDVHSLLRKVEVLDPVAREAFANHWSRGVRNW